MANKMCKVIGHILLGCTMLPIYMTMIGLCDWAFGWPHWVLATCGEKTDWGWAVIGWIIIVIISYKFTPVGKEYVQFCKEDTKGMFGI